MARPADVTEERIAAWLAKASEPPDGVFKPTPEMLEAQQEVTCASFWVMERMASEANADEALQVKAQNVFGQIALGRDPWKTADILIRVYKASGMMVPPGKDLAEALLHGHLDEIFGVGASINTREGRRRMMQSLGVRSLDDLLARTGSSSVVEAKEKLKKEIAKMEAEFEEDTPG